MNGLDLRNLEIQYAAEYYKDIIDGRIILLFWLIPGGFYGCGSASGMGRVYVLHFFAWLAITIYGMPSWHWYGICWLGGIVTFWCSWYTWRKKVRAQAPPAPREVTFTLSL